MSGANNANKRQTMEVMDEAVARALSDNLAPLKRTVEDLQRAFADLVAQCDSNRGSAALPAMLRAQSSAASLAAGLGVLSSFVAMTLRPGDRAATAAAPALGNGVGAPALMLLLMAAGSLANRRHGVRPS